MAYTIDEIKKLSEEDGYYFFEPDTIAFWNSTIYPTVWEGNYFITSEDNYDRSEILFSIRQFLPTTNGIHTVVWQKFKTYEEAEEFINEYLSRN